ncbi:hypothetical protein Ga0074812_15418 [Parafrankia irregularis]|uniref:ATP/GTP-binding protein n=1 Tax=Parafrankia irregularis TaxID=795642 RepID=A0A0S4R1L5_9ACTN|nr:ATP/GTP-binding protein [Parafrankia sp. CH37]CUU61058.1 hypothetical protein Ga0074812_15418 [Parafrankia irregularis]
MLIRRGAVLLVLGMAALGVLATPAFADDKFGSALCTQNPYPGCELFAGDNGGVPLPDEGSVPSGGGRAASPAPGDRALDAPSLPIADCAYARSDFQPPAPGLQAVAYSSPAAGGLVVRPAAFRPSELSVRPVASQPGQGAGAWYVYRCTSGGEQDALYRAPVWIPDAAAGPAPDPEALAEQARSQLRLSSPPIVMNPSVDQLVGLPTWLWLDAAGWNQVAATAAAGGVSVTAVAKPVQVTWSLGDGGTVTCTGPGTPFPDGANPKNASPDCGYTYRRRSLDTPGGTFAVTATVRWDVTWAGAGQAGAFPGLTTVSTTAARVIDVPALTTGGG